MIDFLVIGAGIAGLSAAARLSAHGSVCVLEAEDALGYHSSGRSAALFEPSYGVGSTLTLSQASADFFHNSESGYLTPRGLLLVGGHDQRATFEQECRDLSMTPLSFEQALDMVPILNPDTVGYTAFHTAAWDIDTDLLLQDFAKQVRANGGQVMPRRKVDRVTRTKTGWQVHAADMFEARILLNASGAWADEVATLAGVSPIGITPYRRSMARLPAPGGQDLRHWPMLFGVGESWYAKPDAGALIVSPSEMDPTTPHDAFADDMVLAEGLARYEQRVTEPVTRLLSNWAGLRSFVPDKNLVLGPDPADPSFVWVAAQGGYGFQTAPAASQLVADLVCGLGSDLDDDTINALSPERLRT
ncbi:FAD-binding oxidoreductase [Tropicibacter sp. Alg240-R139]|uniref:NAD(P)/FAD-dependent oxidoreductase n=1 Tax=Tropicibacter sp. Alg240-R139 TaxID=2305991 RepID=UPI0013E0D2CA|nr:FAD-dependent oxidoreductase [Tropicibacter sp. Alg240-R139]